MMGFKVLAIVVPPDDVTLLSAEVGGMAAGAYLIESLGCLDQVDVRLAVDGDTSDFPGLDEYRRVPSFRLRDLSRDVYAGTGVLIIDGRAWIPPAALNALIPRVWHSREPFRVVGPVLDSALAGLSTLCMYLPPGRDRSDCLARPPAEGRIGLDRIFNSTILDAATVLDASDIFGAAQTFLMDSYHLLAEAERNVLLDRANSALGRGVRIRDPHNVYIRGKLSCGTGVEIDVNVIIEGAVELGDGVRIAAHSIVRDSRIGNNTRINSFSLIERAQIGADGFIGPYGRIRPGSDIGNGVQIGNYVEIKNSRIGAGCRINHHAFIGDAVLGERVTIGAGTITCNHDGVRTNQTIIDRDAYIGSGCNLVAPIRIGEGAVVGAGSTITRDVPAAKLTLARAPQTTIENWKGPTKG